MFLSINLNRAIADTGHYSVSPITGAITPEISGKIALKKVNVMIKANKTNNSISAKCEFDFLNETAEQQDVLMGFPVGNVAPDNLGIREATFFSLFKQFSRL